jgi:hypothetical protein
MAIRVNRVLWGVVAVGVLGAWAVAPRFQGVEVEVWAAGEKEAGPLTPNPSPARGEGSKTPLAPNAAPAKGEEGNDAPEVDPLGANGACYVCHIPFVKEELATTHLKAKVACVKCHGLSDKHANDEHIGATKPDITYKRDKIAASCRKCHTGHDVPPEKVLARAFERKLPSRPAVCTDCHGHHKIQRQPPVQETSAGAGAEKTK